MTEEIKEGFKSFFKLWNDCGRITFGCECIDCIADRDVFTDALYKHLDSIGCVLKVNGELPNENSGKHTWYDDDYGEAGRIGYRLAISDVEEAGYTKTERLV